MGAFSEMMIDAQGMGGNYRSNLEHLKAKKIAEAGAYVKPTETIEFEALPFEQQEKIYAEWLFNENNPWCNIPLHAYILDGDIVFVQGRRPPMNSAKVINIQEPKSKPVIESMAIELEEHHADWCKVTCHKCNGECGEYVDKTMNYKDAYTKWHIETIQPDFLTTWQPCETCHGNGWVEALDFPKQVPWLELDESVDLPNVA